jgi:hypothetical protein
MWSEVRARSTHTLSGELENKTRHKEVYGCAVPCLREENTFMNGSKEDGETEPSRSRAMLCCFCVTTAQNRASQTFQIRGTTSKLQQTLKCNNVQTFWQDNIKEKLKPTETTCYHSILNTPVFLLPS